MSQKKTQRKVKITVTMNTQAIHNFSFGLLLKLQY